MRSQNFCISLSVLKACCNACNLIGSREKINGGAVVGVLVEGNNMNFFPVANCFKRYICCDMSFNLMMIGAEIIFIE